MNARRSLLVRFLEKVNVPSADANFCWPWKGATPNGYGTIAEGWKGGRPVGLLYAHRCAWKIAHGSIPEGAIVRHRCDNKACVRPSHLELGTRADNGHDVAMRCRGTKSRSGLPRGIRSHGPGYQARVKWNSRERDLGTFRTVDEAADAVCRYREFLYPRQQKTKA